MSRKIRDAFDSVKADEQMKEKTKENLMAQLEHCSKRRFYQRPVFYRTLAGALLLVLVFAWSMKAYEIKAEAAYITMEGPVEIGISVNGKDTVISAEGLNADGENIVSQVDVTGMHYREALQAIMETDSYQECQGGRAKVKVSCLDDKQEADMQQSADETCHSYGRQYREHHGQEHEEETEGHREKHSGQYGRKHGDAVWENQPEGQQENQPEGQQKNRPEGQQKNRPEGQQENQPEGQQKSQPEGQLKDQPGSQQENQQRIRSSDASGNDNGEHGYRNGHHEE